MFQVTGESDNVSCIFLCVIEQFVGGWLPRLTISATVFIFPLTVYRATVRGKKWNLGMAELVPQAALVGNGMRLARRLRPDWPIGTEMELDTGLPGDGTSDTDMIRVDAGHGGHF